MSRAHTPRLWPCKSTQRYTVFWAGPQYILRRLLPDTCTSMPPAPPEWFGAHSVLCWVGAGDKRNRLGSAVAAFRVRPIHIRFRLSYVQGKSAVARIVRLHWHVHHQSGCTTSVTTRQWGIRSAVKYKPVLGARAAISLRDRMLK